MAYTKHYPATADYPAGCTVTLGDGDGISFDENGYVHSAGNLDLKPPEMRILIDDQGCIKGVRGLDLGEVEVNITGVNHPIARIRTLIEQHPSVFGELNGECPYQRALEFLESMVK